MDTSQCEGFTQDKVVLSSQSRQLQFGGVKLKSHKIRRPICSIDVSLYILPEYELSYATYCICRNSPDRLALHMI